MLASKNILVLCTGNSCRSQIAEGYLRYFTNETIGVYSAGIQAHGINPMAIRTMMEDGIDISNQTSNPIHAYADIEFDFLITVCDHANENCPILFTNAIRIHQNFPDPARVVGSDEDKARVFREVRESIKSFSKKFVETYL